MSTRACRGQRARRQRGAGLVESVVVIPLLLFVVMLLMQMAMMYYAKSSLNYATFEAARAGSMNNASISSINLAFQKALLPYYGGGRTSSELEATLDKVSGDLAASAFRVEILSPSQESFDDYNSPQLQAKLDTDAPVIPNVGLDSLTCPRDVPACISDPATNASGQTLLDANLLKLRITYGIPPAKQLPMAGKFFGWALDKLGAGDGDAFKQALIAAGRIPVVTHTVLRMQSDPIKNALMVSSPGPGNNGTPTDPGPVPPGEPLPGCPWWNPTCSMCPDGMVGSCEPDICTGG